MIDQHHYQLGVFNEQLQYVSEQNQKIDVQPEIKSLEAKMIQLELDNQIPCRFPQF